ncbi:3212_t:CDS:2, partial [Diversispora eburnea]
MLLDDIDRPENSRKELKKLINRVHLQPGMQLTDDDNIIGYFFTLDQELHKVNTFFLKKRAKLELILEKYRYLYNTNGLEDTFNGIINSVLDPKELRSALMEQFDTNGKILTEMLDSIDQWIRDIDVRIKADSKFQFLCIELTKDQNDILIHSVENDDVDTLQGQINDLINKTSKNVQNHIKK